MKLSDFFVLYDVQQFLRDINCEYFDKYGEDSTPEGARIWELCDKIDILLQKVSDEVEKGKIEDDREPINIEDLVKMLNESTEYNWEVSCNNEEEVL